MTSTGHRWRSAPSLFGKLVRRLVDEGVEVRPGQAIAEVAYRGPTLAEYTEVWREARRAEDRVHELEHEAPLRAAWRAPRRRRA